MRTLIVLVGMTINLVLVLGIIYLNYFAPRPAQHMHIEKEKRKRSGITRRIALICPGIPISKEVISGFTETLQNEAQFTPEIKIFDANSSRTLMRSNIEAAIEGEYDVLVPVGSQASQMTKEITEKRDALIPTVFTGTGDPVKLELVKSPEKSGNHLTGVCALGMDWIHQMVSLIPVIAPHVKKILIPYDPTGLGGALEVYKQRFDDELEKLNYKVKSVPLAATNEITEKVVPFLEDTDMILVLPDFIMVEGMDQISKLSEQYGKCIYVAQNLAQLKKGATFAFGYRLEDQGVCVAHHVRRIIENREKPTDIPVNGMDSAYRIGVNLDNARAQGVLEKLDESILFLMESGEVV